jgi:hypothetical protein
METESWLIPLTPAADARPDAAVPLEARVVVVRRGRRPVGALAEGDVRWIDVRPPRAGAVAVAAMAVTGATAVGLRWAARPSSIGRIAMGPGGWVSVRGAKPPLDPADRPWWARLLHAYRL